MIDNADPKVVAVMLVLLANRIVEGIATPLRVKWPNLDLWWLQYVSWLIGGLLVFTSGINLLPVFPAYPLIGQILTAIVIGGGASITSTLLDVVSAKSPPTQVATALVPGPTKFTPTKGR